MAATGCSGNGAEAPGVWLFQADAQEAMREGFVSFLLPCKAEPALCRNHNYMLMIQGTFASNKKRKIDK